MARNVEIKARVPDRAAFHALALAMADGPPTEIAQDDTFFRCASGRLKLRAFSLEAGELIFYRRPDGTGPRQSEYALAPTADPRALRDLLTAALGGAGRVLKRRTLFMTGQTRIHVDAIEGLGDYMELEVVLRPKQTAEEGMVIARQIMDRLHVAEADLVETAYVDLLDCAKAGSRIS